jgi:hypothetical protein
LHTALCSQIDLTTKADYSYTNISSHQNAKRARCICLISRLHVMGAGGGHVCERGNTTTTHNNLSHIYAPDRTKYAAFLHVAHIPQERLCMGILRSALNMNKISP